MDLAATAVMLAKDAAKSNVFTCATPNNKISLAPGSKTCDNCGVAGKMRCSACPSGDSTLYCSKACQKHDWSKHKMFCRSKQVYAATRQLSLVHDIKSEEGKESMAQFAKALRDSKLDRNILITLYLVKVEPNQRPATMLGGPSPRSGKLKQSVIDDIDRLRFTTTPEEHSARAIELGKTKYKDAENHHSIPFADRPCFLTDVVGIVKREILLSLVDYETVSIGMFDRFWGLTHNVGVDPWRQTIPTEAYAAISEIGGEVTALY